MAKKQRKLGKIQQAFVDAMAQPRAQVWSEGAGYKVTHEGQKASIRCGAKSVAALVKRGVLRVTGDGLQLAQ